MLKDFDRALLDLRVVRKGYRNALPATDIELCCCSSCCSSGSGRKTQ